MAPSVLGVEGVLVLFALAQPATSTEVGTVSAARPAAHLRFLFDACVVSPLRGLAGGSATEGPSAPSPRSRVDQLLARRAAAYPGTTIFPLLEWGIALLADSRVAIWSPEAWNGISVYSV